MVVPLPQLRHLQRELADVGIAQVVAVTATVLVQRLGDFFHALGDQVVPDAPAFDIDGGRHRAIGIDRVAAMDEKVRVAIAHLFVDFHAAEVGVDAEILASRVAAPDKARAAPRIERRRAKLGRDPFAARACSGQVLHGDTGEDLLARRQFCEVDAGREIGYFERMRADDPACIGEAVGGVPLQQHAGRLVAARPDHAAGLHTAAARTAEIVEIEGIVAMEAAPAVRHQGGVTQLQPVRQVRPHALRSHQRRGAQATGNGQAQVGT